MLTEKEFTRAAVNSEAAVNFYNAAVQGASPMAEITRFLSMKIV